MTVLESLKAVNGYPVPETVFATIALKRGLTLTDAVTDADVAAPAYRLAQADVWRWVSTTPNTSQADVSYSLLSADREQLRSWADAVYKELGDEAYSGNKTKFGYKGNRL
jgi:hypothetical protein